MPAISDKQSRLFRLALSVKRGETPRNDVSQAVLDIVDNMEENKIKDFTVVEDAYYTYGYGDIDNSERTGMGNSDGFPGSTVGYRRRGAQLPTDYYQDPDETERKSGRKKINNFSDFILNIKPDQI